MIPFSKYFLITEAASDIVWHISDNPYKILKNNKFSLGSETGPNITNSGKPFYLSVARSKLGSYSRNPRAIIFKLDGREFNKRYKSFPIDYWGGSGFRDRSSGVSEMEDRIASLDPIIPDARKYILEIIGWADEHSKQGVYSFYQKKVEDLSKELGIPFVFYNSYEDFIQNKNPHKSVSDVVDLTKIEEISPYKSPFSYRKNNLTRIKYLLNFLLNLKDPEHSYGRYHSNLTISADYGNLIIRNHDKTEIFAKKLLANAMKRLNLKNIDELLKLRLKQLQELETYKNDIKHMNYKFNQYVKNLNDREDKDFEDFYSFSNYYLGKEFEELSRLYIDKDVNGMKQLFEKYQNILQAKIDNILQTSMNIHINPTPKKKEDFSWRENQI
jgi:hypothetical protein